MLEDPFSSVFLVLLDQGNPMPPLGWHGVYALISPLVPPKLIPRFVCGIT